MSAWAATRRAVSNAVVVDRLGFAPLLALRAAAGITIPFAVGFGVGHPAEGAIAAAGALPAGVAGMGGAPGTSAAVIGATALGMSISTFVGGLVAGHLAPTLVVLAGWGFLAGLTAVLGRSATVVGTQAVMGLIVFGRFPGGVESSAAHAGWVLAGAGLQGLLAVVVRPPKRFATERRVLANAYAELARVAQDHERTGLQAASLTAAARALVERRGPGEDVDVLRGLVDEADRIRLELQALATMRAGSEATTVAATAAIWLRGISSSILQSRPAPSEPAPLGALLDRVRQARDAAPPGRAGTAARFTAARSAALVGQLRAASRLTAALAGARAFVLPRALTVPGAAVLTLPRRTASTAQRLVGAATDPRSSAFRHAVRLAVLLPGAEALSHALPWERGYWVPLTALVVLKPDYAATTQRGIARIAGTGIGVVVAGAVVQTTHPNGVALTVLLAAAAWAGYATFAASYALYSVFITMLVVLLLAPIGGSGASVIADRGIDTLIGGALALAGYLIWPTWEGRSLSAAVDDVLAALAAYAQAVLDRYVDPEGASPAATAVAAATARRARIAAMASLARAAAEPQRGGADVPDASGRLAAARRIVIALHALRTTLDDTEEHVAVPEVAPLRDAVVTALDRLAHGEPAEASRLREMQEALESKVPADSLSLHARRLALLAAHLDPLVDSVDTLAHVSAESSAEQSGH